MELQKKIDQTIYNLCQLILKRKYKRAIYIAESIETQGFSSHQLLTLKSYAISKSQGPQRALESIKYEEGPLIAMAKAQYNQSQQNWQEVKLNLEHLIVENEQSQIDNFLNSNEILQKGLVKSRELVNSRTVIFVSNTREQQCTSKINQVTLEYNEMKLKKESQEISLKQFGLCCYQLAQKYANILKAYRPKKQILILLQQYIKYLRQQNEF